MRSLCRISLAMGLAALLASPAFAQPPGGRGRGMGGGGGVNLTSKSIQEELKISSEQATKLGEVGQKIREKYQDDFSKIMDMSAEERAALMKKVGDDTQKEFGTILNADQLKRYKQLQIQQQGPMAFVNNEDLTKALKLSDEQKEKIKTITDDYTKDRTALFPRGGRRGGGGARGADPAQAAENFKKGEALRTEATGKVVSVLNADQKKTYQDMTGKSFEFKYEAPARRGGG